MLKNSWLILITFLACSFAAWAQAPGGRSGIPNVTPAQTAAIVQMNADLASGIQALTDARTAVIQASLEAPGTIKAKVEAVRAAELALATARADAFQKLQASPNKLSSDQVAVLVAGGGRGGGGRGAGGGATGRGGARTTTFPHATPDQANALMAITHGLTSATQSLTAARAALTAAAYAVPRNDAGIRSKADDVASAEAAVAVLRSNAFAKVQASANKLDDEQLASLVVWGGDYPQANGLEAEPYDFNDHRGYVSLFDGVSLKGWDGNPKFWRAEGGAIVGESTAANPSGNTYIAYRDVVARDFTLKFEIKVEGDGGSGLQYRSKTGIPWLTPVSANVIANTGPVNLAWMMTGPQADFWPSRVYSGQFYSENTPMRIEAWRGEVVEGAGVGGRRIMGSIGDRTELGKLVKMNDWNEYTVIARGGTFIHVLNGQLMAVMVDDDPNSSNNQPGIFGIEIEATTKVSVRNIWLKKLD